MAAKRRRQQVAWLWSMLDARLLATLRTNPRVRAVLPGLERAVRMGELPATVAVEQIMTAFGVAGGD